MKNTSSWRELLAQIIRDPQQKALIAERIGVQSITLERWIRGQGKPRQSNIQKLLEFLTEEQHPLSIPLAQALAEEKVLIRPRGGQIIPSTSYARVLRILAETPLQLPTQNINQSILSQALAQLDLPPRGMALFIAQCLPAMNGGKIRSLRAIERVGNPPLGMMIEARGFLLGAESLTGQAAYSGQIAVIQDYSTIGPMRKPYGPYILSAASVPIKRLQLVSGCLTILSPQAHFFTLELQELLQQYADILALAFKPEEFYHQRDFDLRAFPHWLEQQRYFDDLQQRIRRIQDEARQGQQPLSHEQAELRAWQQIEDELIRSARFR